MLGNHVELIGFLGSEPKMTAVSQGTVPVANFSVATTIKHKAKDGQQADITMWHYVTFFGRTAENIGRFCHKGTQVMLTGHLNRRTWQDAQGQDHERVEVIGEEIKFLPSGGRSQGEARPKRVYPPRQANREDEIQEDAIPF